MRGKFFGVLICVAVACASPVAAAIRRPVPVGSGLEGIHLYGPRQGIASFYGSSRSRALTAAHRTLPFGTQVRVTNANNGQSVVVLINDRGPFRKGRVIDVSFAAARALGMISSGVAPVKLAIVRAPPGHVVPHAR